MVERERQQARTSEDETIGLGLATGVDVSGLATVIQTGDKTGDEARHEKVMASAKRVMTQHRDVFAALAK